MSEPHQGNFVEKKIILKSNRVFFLKFVDFNNGCFVSFSEDCAKLAAFMFLSPLTIEPKVPE